MIKAAFLKRRFFLCSRMSNAYGSVLISSLSTDCFMSDFLAIV